MYTPDEINNFIKNGKDFDTNLVSDGYHTFGELYDHRIALFITLCRVIANNRNRGVNPIWKSKLHHDGTSFDGWFIMGINTDKGNQMSYHLPMSKWDETNFPGMDVFEKAPEWDGHTPADVIERLKTIASPLPRKEEE